VFAFLSIPALGLAQWFVLRRYFAEAEWWILATVCTSVAMTVLSYVLPRDDHGFILFGLVPTLQGALYGLATWMVFVLVLKRSTSASKAFDLQT
jgi:hypothetical protein